jgi:TonB-dependent starch-binding outer membrane protein SusC
MTKVFSFVPKTIALSIVFLLFSVLAFAQTTVTGKVTDAKGTPLNGITVSVKGARVGTSTSNGGVFTIKLPANATTLVFTSVSYNTQEVVVTGGEVNVSMVENATQLTDVVVVAYGTRKKTDLTGAVTQVTAKDFQKGNINSSEQLLQGKVAGLQITPGGGSAGGGSRIRIRGGASLNASNDPLIVIDGVPVDGNGVSGSANVLNSINPADIESMSVQKDAAATALYGARASNGVIIITTKKGTRGKLKFNYSSNVNLSVVGKKVDVLTADEIRTIVTEDAAKTGNNTYKNLLGTANTDWQSEIYQQALGFDNNIGMSGMLANKLPFRLSVGYLSQEGILKTDKFNRVSTALNLSPKFFEDHLSVNVNLKASQTKNRFANDGAVGAAASFDPTQPLTQTNQFGGNFEWLTNNNTTPINTGSGSSQPNPLSLLQFRDNRAVVNRFIGNVQLDYKLHFLPDLRLQLNVGMDRVYGKGDDIISPLLVTQYRVSNRGRVSHYAQIRTNRLIESSLFYAKEIKAIKTKLDVLALHSFQDFRTDQYNYESFAASDNALIPNTTPTFFYDRPQNRLESYLGRVNFTINNKYIFTGSIRRDASSKFAPEKRVGYFPAGAVAWKMRDDLFPNAKWVNEFKLRYSYGVTGQQDGIGLYSYLPVYSASGNAGASYQLGDQFISYLRPGPYDPNIQWESTATQNLGIDFGFFGNRVTGALEVYHKKTRDLLSVVPVAAGGNFNIEILTNVGNIENKGVEFTLNTIPVKTKNFSWDFGFNVTYNYTEITNLLKNEDPNFKGIPTSGITGGTGNNIGSHLVGFAPNTFFVFKQVYDPQTNNPIEGLYEDLNRDGIINDADRYMYKKPAADFLFGINTQFNYKQFYLGFAAHGTIGNYMYNNYFSNNGVLRAMQNPLNFVSNVSRNYLSTRFANNQFLSDYYIENASFLRLDNINLGYNVGKILDGKANLRLAASVQNVFVITNYKGMDPENAGDGQIDNTIYPRPRIYSLGLNLDF